MCGDSLCSDNCEFSLDIRKTYQAFLQIKFKSESYVNNCVKAYEK